MQTKNNSIKINLSFPRNVVGNLPHTRLLCKKEKPLDLTKYEEDPRQKHSGMTPDFMGFTLIEILVVVLIIGILAAVALPQFQFAVDKARAMTHFQNAQGVVKAQQLYKMANGNYTGDFTALDVDWTKTCKQVLGTTCKNELKDCPGNWSFHLPHSNCEALYFELNWCTGAPCYSQTLWADRHITMWVSLQDGTVTSCIGHTTRGEKLCKYFIQQFGTNNN